VASNSSSNAGAGGMSIFGFVFLLFLGLKLGEVGVVAGWSWWWVTAPLWGPVAAFLMLVVIVAVVAGIIALFSPSTYRGANGTYRRIYKQ
jgi:hypothetical protein